MLHLLRIVIGQLVAVHFSQLSHSVLSNSLWPHGLQHVRPPCSLPTPGIYSNSCPLRGLCHTMASWLYFTFFNEGLAIYFNRVQEWAWLSAHQSVRSLSCVRLFATPWMAAHQASLSITNSQSSHKLTSIESVMPFSHLILCRVPFSSCLQSLPVSESSPMS